MAILDAIKAVQDLMIAVSGVKSAPDYPAPGIFPIVITHLSSGTIHPGNAAISNTSLNNIVVEVHVSDQGLAAAYETLETLHPLIVAALAADTTFGGTLQTYGDLTFATTRTEWDGSPTLLRAYVLNNCKIIA